MDAALCPCRPPPGLNAAHIQRVQPTVRPAMARRPEAWPNNGAPKPPTSPRSATEERNLMLHHGASCGPWIARPPRHGPPSAAPRRRARPARPARAQYNPTYECPAPGEELVSALPRYDRRLPAHLPPCVPSAPAKRGRNRHATSSACPARAHAGRSSAAGDKTKTSGRPGGTTRPTTARQWEPMRATPRPAGATGATGATAPAPAMPATKPARAPGIEMEAPRLPWPVGSALAAVARSTTVLRPMSSLSLPDSRPVAGIWDRSRFLWPRALPL